MKERKLFQILLAFLSAKNYAAAYKIFFIVYNPINFLARYLVNGGYYPCIFKIKTPLGVVDFHAERPEDLYTLVEIFIWEIYKTSKPITNFIDIGGNVGLASLYFLTRNLESQGYIIEPLESNVLRLRHNLRNYTSRLTIVNKCVSNNSDNLLIGIEPTGRYSGIDCLDSGVVAEYPSIGINELIHKFLFNFKFVELIKIDCEGAEHLFINKITISNLKKIKNIIIETSNFDDSYLLNNGFIKNIIYLENKNSGVYLYKNV
jgi:FkbM family methyltransferase